MNTPGRLKKKAGGGYGHPRQRSDLPHRTVDEALVAGVRFELTYSVL